MIKRLAMKNFKCFEDMGLDLKAVNILTGLNGMGKSTVLQSLLLLRQSFQENQLTALKLNGKYVRLGNGQDVLAENAQDERIVFSVEEEQTQELAFSYVPLSDRLPRLNPEAAVWKDSVLYGNRLLYLSAYRIEPRELYGIEDMGMLAEREFSNSGEYAIQYLEQFGSKKVENPAVCLGEKGEDTLQEQVRFWMESIAPGVAPRISANQELRTAELRFEFTEGKVKTNPYKNINVGFGITYVLPVIVAILSAKPGDLILLENPEAHIHPAGQRRLGELAAAAGAGGVQVILETHSDHVLNGIRTAVKKHVIDCGQTGIFFFYKDLEDAYRHKVACPHLDLYGRLDFWPKGFFDEWDNALMELL